MVSLALTYMLQLVNSCPLVQIECVAFILLLTGSCRYDVLYLVFFFFMSWFGEGVSFFSNVLHKCVFYISIHK